MDRLVLDLSRNGRAVRHLFDPTKDKNWPSIGNYPKKCPICAAAEEIDHELKGIFKMR